EYCVAVAEAAEPEFRGPRQLALLAQGDRERDNGRAALGWALEQGESELGLRLGGILWEYWVPRGLQTEGRRWLDALLALDRAGAKHPASPSVRAKALRGASIMARQQGDLARSEALAEECMTLSRQLGDEREMGVALSGLGQVALKRGELGRARELLEESLAMWRRLGDTRRVALELGNLASVALLQHDDARAVALKEEALALQRLHGSRTDIAQALASLGHARRSQGDHQGAAALLREALILLRDTRYALIAAPCLEMMASILWNLGEPERAARLLGAATALQSAIGTSRLAEVEADYERTVALVRNALGQETFEAAWAAGTTLGLEEAIAEALGEAE
ncbi:MAG TPA: tetratricopeptide repeat protein, partial [Ktedonobacterales bacterium]|nr:tetratricopeptide repeat protein [Ktedonobacterales bacterium]